MSRSGSPPKVLRSRFKTIRNARSLRCEMTLPEVLLWQELRRRPGGFKFRRQFPQGRYVLDFACLASRLGIEVDGEVHSLGDNPFRDQLRDADLNEMGFAMLRIPAGEVLGNLEGVVTAIVEACRTPRPLHQPSAGPPPRSGED